VPALKHRVKWKPQLLADKLEVLGRTDPATRPLGQVLLSSAR
jgi:hypothetical protein